MAEPEDAEELIVNQSRRSTEHLRNRMKSRLDKQATAINSSAS